MAPKLPTGSFAQLPVAGKVMLLVLLLGVLTAGYYVGIHMALEEETDSAMARHATLEQQLREAGDRQREYLKLRAEVSAREALDKQNLRILPESTEMPAFLDDLNRLAELSGLQMEKVEPDKELPSEFYIKVPVKLKVRGRYHELAKFFYNVSRLERAINMEEIAIYSGARGGTGEAQLGVDVKATTFRRKE